MDRFRAQLAYDGTNFHGSQRQPELRTVQSEVERALARLAGEERRVLFAGRTDAGVHAAGQVIAFDLEWNHGTEELQRAFNALLPADISTREVKQTRDDFHPRYDAQSRRYRYQIRNSPHRDPLQDRYCWQVWPELSLPRMIQAAEDLEGVHDFRAFGSPHRPEGSTVRRMESTRWDREQELITFDLVGNAFLYHMVRHIVILLVRIGKGQEGVQAAAQYLQSPEGDPVQGLAPAKGLILQEVIYQK